MEDNEFEQTWADEEKRKIIKDLVIARLRQIPDNFRLSLGGQYDKKKEINHLERLMLEIARTQTEMVCDGFSIPNYPEIIQSLQARHYTLSGRYFNIKEQTIEDTRQLKFPYIQSAQRRS